jgi:hypothetical protein
MVSKEAILEHELRHGSAAYGRIDPSARDVGFDLMFAALVAGPVTVPGA